MKKRYEIVYYRNGERNIFWPADSRSDVLMGQLLAARSLGLVPRLASVG